MKHNYFKSNQCEEMARNLWVYLYTQMGVKSAKSMSAGSEAEGRKTEGRASNEHPLSIHSASIEHPLQGQGKAVKMPLHFLRYVAMIFAVLVMSIGQMWGANGDVLFSQNFNSATTSYAVYTATTLNSTSSHNVFGNTAASQFTSFNMASKDKVGYASNTSVTVNGTTYNYSGKFGVRAANTGGTYSLMKTTDFAATAPTALKVVMTMKFTQGSSGSDYSLSFAVGDGFTDGTAPASTLVHSGFSVKNNSNADICGYRTNTAITSQTKISQSEITLTWVINNTGSSLTYTGPDSKSHELADDKFDVWEGSSLHATGSASTGSMALQELYIGDPAGKNHEFYLDDIAVTDLTPAASCTAPSSVTVGPTSGDGNYGWRYSTGETIDLTASTSGDEVGTPTYQWQKYIEDDWEDIVGATSARYQKENCTSSDGGSYRCVVTMDCGGDPVASAGYYIRVFTLDGNYYGAGDWIKNAITWTGANTGYVRLHLEKNKYYKFKITDNDGKWFGESGTITGDITSAWDFNTDKTSDCTLNTNTNFDADYVLYLDITYAKDGTPPTVKVTATFYRTYYMQLCSDWKAATAKYAMYYWKNGEDKNGWSDFMEATDCDEDILSATIPAWADRCIFGRFNPSKESTGSWDDKYNQTSDVTIQSNKDYYKSLSGSSDSYLGSWDVFSEDKYTISFDAGDGSGSMSDIADICSGTDQAITANSFTAPTGYEFDAWHADEDVTVSSATVAAGSDIADEATLESLGSDVTLTAQWKPKTYTITLAKGDHGAAAQSATVNYDATAVTSITDVTSTGYDLTGYYDGSTKVLNAGGTFAGSSISGYITDSKWTKASDCELTAKWSAKTTTVTINANTSNHGSTAPSSFTATYDQALPSFTAATGAAGYSLKGYYTDATGGTKVIDADGTFSANSGTWNRTDGATLTLYAQYEDASYGVTHTLSNVTKSSGATTATHGTNYTAVFAAADDYALPDAITVTINDVEVTENTEYTWDSETGTLTIDGDYITGNIEITIAGEEDDDCSPDTLVKTVITGYSDKKCTHTTTGTYKADPSIDLPNTTQSATIGGNSVTGYKLGSSGHYFYVNLSGAYLKAGDIIKVVITKANDAYQVESVAQTILDLYYGSNTFLHTITGVSAAGEYSYTLSASDISTIGASVSKVGVYRPSSGRTQNPYVYSIEVTRPCVSCSTPDAPTAFAKTSVTSTTATLSITDAGDAASYDLYYASGSPSTPTAETEATTNVTTKTPTITSLTANTTYKAWVRAVCDESNKSSWVALTGTTFTTLNTYTVTYNDNGSTGGTAPTDGSSPYDAGSNVTVLGNTGTLAKTNYVFDGWNTANDGSGTSYAADGTISSIAANVTLYAKWKQTITLKTGSQGSGDDKTPYVYFNGASLNSFTAHTASGYTLNGYYTASSGGTKVLNADGSFAAANVTDYITSSKWSRTGAAPTLYAQWRASASATCYEWDATETKPQTGTNSYDGLYLTASTKVKVSFYKDQEADSCFSVSDQSKTLYGHLNGTEIDSVVFAASSSKAADNNTMIVIFCSTQTFDTANIIKVGGYQATTYTVSKNDAAKTIHRIKAPAGTKSFAIGRNYAKITVSSTLYNSGNRYLYYLKVCSAGGGTHTISYNNGGGSGDAMASNTGITHDGSQTLTSNTYTAPSNYSFAGWVADGAVTIGGDVKTAGTLIADGATITNITMDIALTAKWSQSVTLDDNDENHGATGDGSATAYYNATSLSSITHTEAATGYKLAGYYTAKTDGTKVLNSDGTFAGSAVTGWISDSKWTQNTTSTPTLYAQYESAGALTWNLIVNSDTANLSTSTKTSAFTEISTTNMTNAALTGLTYSKGKKSSLTGKISTPASYDADKYVYVTFQVASGYKFIPSSIKVIAQPVTTGKSVKLALSDASSSLVMASDSTIGGGKTKTVTLAGDGSTAFEGTVTLKIYCYGETDAYRLGTPITIEGEIEEACGTMPSYTSMSYTTTTFAPGADASGSPITIVGGDNIDTYHWKYNTTNDRTSGTECGSNDASLTPLTDAGAATDVTRYYWCEMENTICGITIKSPAVAITVAAAKSDATVEWTNPASTPNYGGGGYTIKATVNEIGWDGNAADLVITAPAGIRIYNIESGTADSKKYVQADFDVTTAFDRETYSSTIPFTVSADATATYNAISDEEDVTFDACTGGGGAASEELMPVNTDSVNSTVKGWRFAGTGKMWFGHGSSTPGTGSSNIKSLDNTMAGGAINKYYNTGGSYFSFYTEKAITGVRLYVYTSNSNVKVSNVYIANSQFATGTPSSGAVIYEVVYNDDNEGLDKGDNVYSAWAEITFDSEVAAGKYGLIKLDNNVKIAGIGLLSGSSSGADLTTTLVWSETVDDDSNKKNVLETAANFTITASQTGENNNSLGAITYSSNHSEYASVNATTGEVTITGAGTAQITATLAASGCYKKATKTYTIVVEEVTCDIAAGTLSADKTSKCESEDAVLTLTGFEPNATVTWYNGDDVVTHDGSTYTIETEGTTSTLTTDQTGTYSVMVNKGCDIRSNSVTISNKSTSVHATRLVKEWYIKNGRLTPDIALWELGDDCSFVGITASSGWDDNTGLTAASSFYEQDGIVYLKGTEPNANAGAVQDYELTLTVNDGCDNQTLGAEGKKITIHHQQNTDKHVLAFVVRGKDKGGFTDSIPDDQTTSVGLYNAIAANFDVLATNSRSTDDEQKLKEYYSQFDILCITDYPDTKKDKGVNKKSTVDALGALVDIRPILTMEAWVSGLANWRAKGISGSPKSPTTRQYTMDLQCKDHEIFARTELTKVGEGDEAMYRVSMVDNTKEDYATLDATYGSGAHAEKEGYQYGKKPALQGFTFTQEMSDNDLLPIGLIDDGAGNPLQVGIERQHNMEARLMVLGINSYAMERLTDDGERVVINALNYLMKKNQEDIADCSTAFVGGAEGEEKNWNNADNWTGNTVPLPSQKVRILAECEVSSTVHALDVLIVTDGKYNHGSDDAAGKLTIKENGALIVGGKIQAASAPAYNRPRATTPEKLIINTDGSGQAALIFDNEEAETQATVNLYSLGRKPSSYQYQYFAVPMEVVPVNPTFANETHDGTGIYTYVYDEASSGWTRRKYYDDLFAFEGLGITTKSTVAMEYTMTGNLASTATKEITLTHDGAGLNLIGNSWMAPIQIAALAEDNTDTNITKTAYIYCAGRDAVEGAATSGETETAGQWIAIPFSAAEFETWKATGKLSVIPAMQAFQIKVDAEATLTLDYKKVVRGSTNDLNAKLRAPVRRATADVVTMTNIRVADSKTHTDISLFEGDRFSEAFDNGWEAEYMNGDGRSAKLYAETEAGQMAVAAQDDYEGTIVGFEPGQETEYTFSFMGEDNGYYLNDIKLQNSVRITEGETYTFTYEEGDAANRFYISRTAINAPEVATGMENLDAAAPRVQKIIYNDKLYIIRGGRLYDTTGKIVR